MTRAALEQQRDDIPRRTLFVKNRCPSDDIELVQVAEAVDVGAGVEERASYIDVGLRDRPMQRGRVIAMFARVNKIRLILEHAAQLRDVAAGARFEEFLDGRCLPILDFRLQRAPTREAMLTRDIQESRCEFRFRIAATQLRQSIFRQLFEVFE
jgi:hypothetical protein